MPSAPLARAPRRTPLARAPRTARDERRLDLGERERRCAASCIARPIGDSASRSGRKDGMDGAR
eukprot:6472058-Pyramimonas_sp.AAC.1